MALTWAEARARAAQVKGPAYDLHLDLSTPARGTFASSSTVRFVPRARSTFLELSRAEELVVTVDGEEIPVAYDGERIALDGLTVGAPVEVRVTASMPYVTSGEGMHRFTDPADGATYVSAYCGMDIAHRVFACFDQNDLKASISLSVTADPEWTVLANGIGTVVEPGRWTFTRTPALPVALFVVCAGPWASVTWEHRYEDGRLLPCGWHARASAAADLARDAEELRTTTDAVLDHYARLFDAPYPFDSCDQVFAPGLNWGAQENPGCVTYRDELLPRERTTQPERLFRATVIAHEQAHMWFGNLVTMRWFEDTWLQESFADYFGPRVAEDGAGFVAARVPHEAGRKATAYVADERRSTHPVAPLAEEVPDVDAALANFDAISYAKGNSALHQLVTWLGDQAFLAGVNDHLTRHAFGNAGLADFVESLDRVSDRDVQAWVRTWLRTSGYDTVRVVRDGDVPVLVRDGVRPHRFTATAYGDGMRAVDTRLVDLGDEPVRLDDWAGLVVVPNSAGQTFARLRLDDRSWAAVAEHLADVDDPMTRAVLWSTALDLAHTGELGPDEYVDLVGRHLGRERHPSVVASVLGHVMVYVIPHRMTPGEAVKASERIAAACLDGLDAGPDTEMATALTLGVIRTTGDPDLLARWLRDGRTDAGVDLDPGLRWRALRRLAELGAADEESIEAERVRDGSASAELGAATALAARPTPEAKERAWRAMGEDDEVSNRMFAALADGLWSPEQADLGAPYLVRYLEAAPGIAARRGPGFANVVGSSFPRMRLDEAQLDLLREALAGEVPTVLRRQWEDELDDRTRSAESAQHLVDDEQGGRRAALREPVERPEVAGRGEAGDEEALQ